jgi:hypothetical protein
MGLCHGPDAVIDMMRRALATTNGTFRLEVLRTLQTATHCTALIAWSAEKTARTIRGAELAVYGFRDGQIVEAQFFPSADGADVVLG